MGLLSKLFGGGKKEIQVSGKWTQDVWGPDHTYLVLKEPNIEEFFSQKNLPYILPKNKDYIESVSSSENPELKLRTHWTLAYLNHPNPKIIVDTLRADIPLEMYTIALELPYLLTHPNESVAKEAAKVVWKSKTNLNTVFNVIGSKGLISSGVTPSQGKEACMLLGLFCPDDAKEEFLSQAAETFGQDVADQSLKGQLSEQQKKDSDNKGKVSPESLFKDLSEWTKGKNITEAEPGLVNIINSLPEGDKTSFRLTDLPALSVTGDDPRILSFPGQVGSDAPWLIAAADMGRMILNLAYGGVESEAKLIEKALKRDAYKVRISYVQESVYSLIRLQLGIYGPLNQPLHTESLSDILDRNVQDFYDVVSKTGRYELSVHIKRKHLASVYGTIAKEDLKAMPNEIKKLVNNLLKIKPEDRNLMAAARSFEGKHPIDEGM